MASTAFLLPALTALFPPQTLLGELAAICLQPGAPQEKTIVWGQCCYFSPLLRRIIRFLGKGGHASLGWNCPSQALWLSCGLCLKSLLLLPLSRSPSAGVYSFGLFATTIFASAGQVVTGNQAPHFLSVCRPNYTALGCQPPPGTLYITDKGACTGNPALVAAARKAFPSKDAALSAYAATYTVVGGGEGEGWGGGAKGLALPVPLRVTLGQSGVRWVAGGREERGGTAPHPLWQAQLHGGKGTLLSNHTAVPSPRLGLQSPRGSLCHSGDGW